MNKSSPFMAVASKTRDAYSYTRWGQKQWRLVTQQLLRHLTPEGAEWVLRSKHMRWASDNQAGSKPLISDWTMYFFDTRNGVLAAVRKENPKWLLEQTSFLPTACFELGGGWQLAQMADESGAERFLFRGPEKAEIVLEDASVKRLRRILRNF